MVPGRAGYRSDLPAIHPMRAHAESLTGVIYTYLGRPGEALAPLELALAQYVQLEELPGQFDVFANLDLALSLRAGPGDWKRAYGYLRQAQSLAERMGDAERKARISNNLGWLGLLPGRRRSSDRALFVQPTGLDRQRRPGDERNRAHELGRR